jgi:oxygen-independent coproporphyrinogen-3 oxidase
MSVDQRGTFSDAIHDAFTLAGDCEFALEANPSSLHPEKIHRLKNAGVNRVSLGLQSFNSDQRRRIGRHGNPDTVYAAVNDLRHVGISNINLDLIYAVPDQTHDDLNADLEKLVALSPRHISTYSLIIEAGTPLHARGGQEMNDDDSVSMWHFIEQYLGEHSALRRYEISNFAEPGYACRHNVDIWRGGRFLGFGPSASYFDGKSRWTQVSDLNGWMSGESPVEDAVPPHERAVEILHTGLRLRDGWDRCAFSEQTGFEIEDLCDPDRIARFVEDGLIEFTDTSMRLTLRGMLLSNYIQRELHD